MDLTSSRTLIILDTNMSRSMYQGAHRYDTFDLGNEFDSLSNFVAKHKLHELVRFAITELTLMELLLQKKEAFDLDRKQFVQTFSKLRDRRTV